MMSQKVVGDFVTQSNLCVYETDNLLKVIKIMKKYNTDAICIVNENSIFINQLKKSQIKQYIKRNFFLYGNIVETLKKIKVKDIKIEKSTPLIFYRETKAEHAFYFMKYLNNLYAPVVETPIEKKIIGFIWLNDKKKLLDFGSLPTVKEINYHGI